MDPGADAPLSSIASVALVAYRSVELVADVDRHFCRPEIEKYRVYVCRGLRHPREQLWREQKHYIRTCAGAED